MRFLSISGVIVEVRVMRSSAPRRECDLFVSRASGQLAQVLLWEQRWNVRFIGEPNTLMRGRSLRPPKRHRARAS